MNLSESARGSGFKSRSVHIAEAKDSSEFHASTELLHELIAGYHMEIEELQERIRKCRICRLPKESYPLFQGNRNAKIMVISQAPSLNATRIGQKWKDNLSGKTLRGWFGLPDKVFYDENMIYLTAIGKCYPGKGKGSDRLPNPACAEKWLGKEIELLRPKLIITIGKRSFNWFFPEGDYDKSLNGRPLKWNKTTVYPLPHPSGANNAWKTRNRGRLDLIIRNLRRELGKYTPGGRFRTDGFIQYAQAVRHL